jgi:branched-chain amino acid transport system substrate-binding protein
MAIIAMGKPDTKKLALVAHTNDWARGYCDPAKDYIEKNGGEVVLDIAMERGSTDASAQVLQIKARGAEAVLGCLYQPELVILIRDMHKFGVNVPIVGALGADFNKTVQSVDNLDAVKGKFFQPYQFQAKIGTGPLEEFHDIFVKYLTAAELPRDGVPTNFYYFGVPVAIATVEAFRRAGPNPTRDKWIEAMESLEGFETNVLADTITLSAENHVGVERMYAVGLNEDGEETVYKAWGVPLEAQ